MSLNRRIHPRSLTDVKATAEFPDGAKRSCVIRDRSDGGARLVFTDDGGLQVRFHVHTSTAAFVAELIWSDGRQAGVRLAPIT